MKNPKIPAKIPDLIKNEHPFRRDFLYYVQDFRWFASLKEKIELARKTNRKRSYEQKYINRGKK